MLCVYVFCAVHRCMRVYVFVYVVLFIDAFVSGCGLFCCDCVVVVCCYVVVLCVLCLWVLSLCVFGLVWFCVWCCCYCRVCVGVVIVYVWFAGVVLCRCVFVTFVCCCCV